MTSGTAFGVAARIASGTFVHFGHDDDGQPRAMPADVRRALDRIRAGGVTADERRWIEEMRGGVISGTVRPDQANLRLVGGGARMGGQAREAPAAPARDELRVVIKPARGAPRRVTIGPRAFATIRDECDLHQGERETTGALLGLSAWACQTEAIHIADATVAARRAAWDRVSLDGAAIDRAGARWRRAAQLDGRDGLIGTWHSHPERDTRPSRHDLRTWATLLVIRDLSVMVSVIAIEGRDRGWRRPELLAWIVKRDTTFDRIVCEPATVAVA
jgi:hypothetical protein